MTKRDMQEAEAQLYWIFVTAYVLRAVGKLPPEKEREIDRFTPEWRGIVEAELEIDTDFVKRLYAYATDRMEETRAVIFIIRGFGCPQTAERLREVLG